MCSSAGFEKATSQSPAGRIKPIIPETGLAPYGLYPQAGITNARHSIGSLEPLRTSLHTYQGVNKLGIVYNFDYMHANIDISQPDYEKVDIKNLNWKQKKLKGSTILN